MDWWSLNPVTGVLIRRKETQTHAHRKRPHDNRSRDWSHIHRPGSAKDGQQPPAARRGRKDSPLAPPERARPCWHRDLGLQVSRSVREYVRVVSAARLWSLVMAAPGHSLTQLGFPEQFSSSLALGPPCIYKERACLPSGGVWLWLWALPGSSESSPRTLGSPFPLQAGPSHPAPSTSRSSQNQHWDFSDQNLLKDLLFRKISKLYVSGENNNMTSAYPLFSFIIINLFWYIFIPLFFSVAF